MKPLLDEARGTYGSELFDLVGEPQLRDWPRPLVGRGDDQRPVHLELGLRRLHRGDADAGRAVEQHVRRCGGESRQPEKASASVW